MSPELQTIINVVGFISIPFGVYVAVTKALAEIRGDIKRIDERDAQQDKRMDGQDKRIERIEDRFTPAR